MGKVSQPLLSCASPATLQLIMAGSFPHGCWLSVPAPWCRGNRLWKKCFLHVKWDIRLVRLRYKDSTEIGTQSLYWGKMKLRCIAVS